MIGTAIFEDYLYAYSSRVDIVQSEGIAVEEVLWRDKSDK
jgi:hypothetical protein